MTRGRSRVLPALALLVGVTGAGCWPQHPKPDQITGVWSVKHQWGIDSLVLAPDGSFIQVLQGRTGPLRATGRWRIEPPDEDQPYPKLAGSDIVLDRAYDFHLLLWEDREPTLGEERIEVVFEWGRTVLIFNPDIEGFTRRGPVPAR